jgi:tripartite-type tricarboxylate transporter receptor subunit TctC
MMQMTRCLGRLFVGVAVLCAALANAASAQDVADFYRGKTVTVICGIAPGGGYDLSARTFARHLGKHIPGNPTVIVQNMPGANSVIAANYVYGIAPQDGTSIWTGSRSTPYEPLMGNAAAKFDVRKLHWLGSLSSEIAVVIAWHTAPHKTAADLFKIPLVVGAVDRGAENFLFPNALNNLIGTKFKIVRGYKNQGSITLAMERGEVQGDGNTAWSNLPTVHGDWLKEKKIRLLMQLALTRHPELPDLPLALDFAKTDEARETLKVLLGMKAFGYPYFIGPGVPPERAKALNEAFAATMADKEFRDDIRTLLREITPQAGGEMDQVIGAAYSHPPDVLAKMRAALTTSEN